MAARECIPRLGPFKRGGLVEARIPLGTPRSTLPSNLNREGKKEQAMFRIYEWTFSSTADLAVGALLVITILSVAFL